MIYAEKGRYNILNIEHKINETKKIHIFETYYFHVYYIGLLLTVYLMLAGNIKSFITYQKIRFEN